MVIVKMIMIRGITNVMIKSDGDDDIDNMIMTPPSNNILTNDHDENNEL